MLNFIWKRSLRLACLGSVSVVLALSCSDTEPVPPVESPDAGADCELGTSGCGCAPVTGCRLGLLCVAQKCLPTEGGQGGVPNTSDVPDLPGYGGDGPSVEDDAGSTPNDVSDAAPPAADTGAPPAADAAVGDGG